MRTNEIVIGVLVLIIAIMIVILFIHAFVNAVREDSKKDYLVDIRTIPIANIIQNPIHSHSTAHGEPSPV